MPNIKYPPIPKPSADPVALSRAGEAMKETLEIMTGVRGDRSHQIVTWEDLVNLGIIVPTQVPK